MPRFHFDVYVGDELQSDPIGTDLPDISSAQMEALRRASDIVQGAMARAEIGQEWHIEVTDDVGQPLFVMEFIVSDGQNPMQSLI